ncbi:hypothetical protein M5K25_024022 [Dendrobium thyrsiflorum]|uniref:Uncharacterized protein n=1 Tax=Dendrobium thyrsiflorum TaxID=117978 RepID=A0ABD0U177_DENTH
MPKSETLHFMKRHAPRGATLCNQPNSCAVIQNPYFLLRNFSIKRPPEATPAASRNPTNQRAQYHSTRRTELHRPPPHHISPLSDSQTPRNPHTTWASHPPQIPRSGRISRPSLPHPPPTTAPPEADPARRLMPQANTPSPSAYPPPPHPPLPPPEEGRSPLRGSS